MSNLGTLVEVKPVDASRWHGKTGKESFTQPRVIEVLVDAETGRYATGLTPEEAEKYGKILGQDLSDIFNPEEPHPYWSTKAAMIELPNQTKIFDTSKPSEYVKVKNLKASKLVANSQRDLLAGNCPDAEFVIFDEEEQMALKATKIQQRTKCIKMLSSMTADQKIDIIQILSDKTVRGRSQDFIDVEIDAIIESDPQGFMKYAKMDKAEVYIRSSIFEGISKNVLQKEGPAIYYMGEKLANDFEDTVAFFLDPQNSKMKVALLEKLKL